MNQEEFEQWLGSCSPDQSDSLSRLRSLILTHTKGLEESINEAKWLHNYAFYSLGETMAYAIGPIGKSKTTFHMLPYYASPEIQEKHAAALAPFLTGKSCIAFRTFSELPLSNLVNILELGTAHLQMFLLQRQKETRAK